MNPKLKLALILSRSRFREQGAILPVILGMGLVMTIAGMTMIVRSSGEQNTAVAQNQTAQALAIAEAGVARVASGLDSTPGLLLRTYDPKNLLKTGKGNEWSSYKEDSPPNSCSATPVPADKAVPTSGSVGTKGNYRLLGYAYNDAKSEGTLLLEGELNPNSDSKARLEVVVPVSMVTIPPTAPSAIMAKKMAIDKIDVAADSITCTDPSLCKIKCAGSEPTPSELRTAIGATGAKLIDLDTSDGNNSNDAEITVGGTTIPPIPAAPGGADINDLGSVNSKISIPGSYKKSSDGIYYFKASGLGKKTDIQVTSNDEVRIYVSGNIDISGNTGIGKNSGFPNPGQIRVYGGSPDGTMPSSQEIKFSGTGCNAVFLHAPNAKFGINGGGKGKACDVGSIDSEYGNKGKAVVYGGLWVGELNTIGSSTGATAYVEQAGLISSVLAGGSGGTLVPTANAFGSWQRKSN